MTAPRCRCGAPPRISRCVCCEAQFLDCSECVPTELRTGPDGEARRYVCSLRCTACRRAGCRYTRARCAHRRPAPTQGPNGRTA